ncbi:hypothetical protein L208DRAFT_1379215 [Tricholoma matsutake]|nr:hypothetical protein L208DRAFT_1379215 [Tricholoma matsutake 945]
MQSIDEHVKLLLNLAPYMEFVTQHRNALPEPDEGDITRDLAHDAVTITESLAACLPPPNIDERTNIFDLHTWDTAFLDMDELVKICFAHQTKQALTGVHTQGNRSSCKSSMCKHI